MWWARLGSALLAEPMGKVQGFSVNLAALSALKCDGCLGRGRAVLCVRSELLRARCGSGMRDAAAAQVAVPEHFGRPAVDTFVE